MTRRLHPIARITAGLVGALAFVLILAFGAAAVFEFAQQQLSGVALVMGALGAYALARILFDAAGKGRPLSRRKLRLAMVSGVAVVVGAFEIERCASRLSDTYERVYVAAMRSDLRNLAVAESAYYAAQSHYTADLSVLDETLWRGPSTGVTVAVEQADSTSWRARAAHDRTSYTCAVSVHGAARADSAASTSPICSK